LGAICLLASARVVSALEGTDPAGDVFDKWGHKVGGYSYVDIREYEVSVGTPNSSFSVTVEAAYNSIPLTNIFGMFAFLYPEDPDAQNGTVIFAMGYQDEGMAMIGLLDLSVPLTSEMWEDLEFDVEDSKDLSEPTFADQNKTILFEEDSAWFPAVVSDVLIVAFTGNYEDWSESEGEIPPIFVDVAPEAWMDDADSFLWDEFNPANYTGAGGFFANADQYEYLLLVIYVLLGCGIVLQARQNFRKL
jgi:hypothetical protein